jgi:two-component system sensor histidine kinase YesM
LRRKRRKPGYPLQFFRCREKIPLLSLARFNPARRSRRHSHNGGKAVLNKIWDLKPKLLLLYFSFTVLLPVLILFFSLAVYNYNAVNIETEFFDYVIIQTSNNFSEKIREYKNILAQIVTNSDMTALFKRVNDAAPDSPYNAVLFNHLSSAFSNYTRMNNYIASAALISNSSEIILYQKSGSNKFLISKLNNQGFHRAFLKYGKDEYYFGVNIMQAATLPDAPDDTKNYVYFTYPAADLITKEAYGIISLEVDNTVFNTVISKHGSTIIDRQISPDSCVTTWDGTIIFSPAVENLGKNIKDLPHASAVVIRSRPIENSSLLLHLFLRRGSLQHYITKYSNIMIAFISISMLFFSATIVFVINRLMLRSKKIAGAISQFRKTYHVSPVNIGTNDEVLFAIADQFNMMSAEIEKLVQELKDKNENIRQAKDQQRRAELQALQAQINPHFIYNALDTINWIAIENDQHKISRMLSELGSLLRYSVSNIDTLVKLRAELEWMEKYVYIQSERFDREIALLRDIDDKANNFLIYKMLLQPLVENSILHGFRPMIRNPEITLSAHVMNDGRLKIKLSDNGRGMDEETLEWMRNIFRRADINDMNNVGVSNVVNRLWHYYGEESEIMVNSRLYQGTSIDIIIPMP